MKKISIKIIAIILFGILSTAFAFAESNLTPVSIGTFKNKSTAPDDAVKSLVDRITNAIVNTRKFQVVDNARLKEIVEEQQKVNMGLSEQDGTEARQGKIKNASYLIYGTVMTIGNNISKTQGEGYSSSKESASCEINLRITDAETGQVIGSKIINATVTKTTLQSDKSASAGNDNDQLVQQAEQKAAQQVVNTLMDLAFPIKIINVTEKNIYLNMTEERAKEGMLLEVFDLGKELKDPDTGASLGRTEVPVGTIEIVRTSPKFAIAKPIGDLTVEDLSNGMICRELTKEQIKKTNRDSADKHKVDFNSKF
ncbi:CsgG/HfaB family protein [Francisella tularensis]|uniref:CsgG/HfaB family protein n=1 Tax=Francisella tularensis TaxID=263 RepID=UPI0008F4FABD|nr:CsgG/HfaB family protein [Francisella tularensis]APA83927.1 Putative periplasmic protein [Francisella tularensis subsp. novicida PA10-7858]